MSAIAASSRRRRPWWRDAEQDWTEEARYFSIAFPLLVVYAENFYTPLKTLLESRNLLVIWFLLEPIEKINKQCHVLCKVQRRIKDGEEVEIDSLLAGMEGFKTFIENQESLTNPTEIKDVVKAPGAFVLPIAIYQ